jgi:YHS domain-containing protein
MANKQNQDHAESGQPGGGVGRRDEPGRTGIWPASGPWPPGDAQTVGQADLGQGARGAAGAEESGGSEFVIEQQDPVCGVHVRPEDSRTTEYGGRRYHFDSEDCMQRFEQSPERYTRRRKGDSLLSDSWSRQRRPSCRCMHSRYAVR